MSWFKRYPPKDLAKALKEAEEKIVIHENRFHGLIENSQEGIIILSKEGKTVYISPSIKRLLGYSEEDALSINIFALSHPDDLPLLNEVLEKILAGGTATVYYFTGRMLHKNGGYRWLEAKVSNLLNEPSINGIVANFTDVTEKKLTREKLIQANRLYVFLSQLNKAIVRAHSEESLFNKVCHIATAYGGFDIVWVGAFDPQTLQVQVAASIGLSSDDVALFEQIPVQPSEPQHHVLHGARYFVCNDIPHSNLERWKMLAKEGNVNSGIILSLRKGGSIHGALSLYSSKYHFFDEQEIALLEEAAGDLSLALDAFEKDRQRLEIEKRLRYKDLRYRQAQRIAHLGSWEFDFATGKCIWSEEACRIYGVSLEEFEQPRDAWRSFVHPEDLARVDQIFKDARKTLTEMAFYFRIIRKDGEIRHLYQQSQFLTNESGEVTGLYGAIHDQTERREAEAAVKDMVEFNQSLIEIAPVGIASFNGLTGKCLSVNPAFATAIGATCNDLQGMDYRTIPSWREFGLLEDANKTLETGEIVQKEISFRSTFGKEAWINYRFVRFYIKDVPHLLLVMNDITEKARLQTLLHRSNRISGIGNYEIDLLNDQVYWSDIFKEIMEVSPDFSPSLAIVHAFLTPVFNEMLVGLKEPGLLEEGVLYDQEVQVTTLQGKGKWVRIIAEAEFSYGKCSRIYGSMQDIDEKKRAEQEVLRIYEEKNDILESIADAFYAVDKNWIVTYWNKESENLLNRDRKEMIGKNLWEAYPHLVDTELYKHYRIVAKENKVRQFVMYYEPMKRWFDISVYPSSNGLSVYFKDVTASKEWEIQLQKLNQSLESYTKELLVSNKNLEQFSYIVSHNLRTPVANILGLSQILKDNPLPDDQRNFVLSELGASVEALDEVIMDLNLILKTKQEFHEKKEHVVFSKLVGRIEKSISSLIQSEQVQIKTDFSKVTGFFTLKSYLHSIFYNLIGNSIKYQFPGRRPVITISSRRQEDKIILTFADNGSGIDLEKNGDQVFGLYRRFHAHIEGKGMGLFMVKTQVEALGGKIHVDSTPGHGTLFEIEFYIHSPESFV